MKRIFVEVPTFTRKWHELGLSDEKKALKAVIKILKEE